MSKKYRYKQMTRDEFNAVRKRNWVPITIVGAALPSWMRGIPKDRLLAVYGSGSYWDERLILADGEVYSEVVGGIDIYRYDPKDEPIGYPINQDHYLVLINPQDNEMLLVVGPIEEDHRWLEKLPEVKPEIVIWQFDDE